MMDQHQWPFFLSKFAFLNSYCGKSCSLDNKHGGFQMEGMNYIMLGHLQSSKKSSYSQPCWPGKYTCYMGNSCKFLQKEGVGLYVDASLIIKAT